MKDTTDFIAQKQKEIIFAKTPAERFMMGIEMCKAARKIAQAGIQQQHKDLTEEQMTYLLFKRYYPSLVEKTEKSWEIYLFIKKIEKYEDFEQIIILYKDFFATTLLQDITEKNYNYLFVALFKKVKSKENFAFVQSEIYRLGLKLNDYTQSFYENLAKKYA